MDIGGVLEAQSSLAEGCACHEELGRHEPAAVRKALLARRLKAFAKAEAKAGQPGTAPLCPLRRSAELACGTFDSLADSQSRVMYTTCWAHDGILLFCASW